MKKVKDVLSKMEGFNINEDKVVLRLKDGTLELYIDHDEETLKIEGHDMDVYVSNELKDRDLMSVMSELSGMEDV